MQAQEIIIDVRERDEYEAEHIENSIHLPLSNFSSMAPGILAHFLDRKIVLMCRSGNRAKMAKTQALALGFNPEMGYEVYEGGMLAWKAQRKPTVATRSKHLPILRQTHLAAGLLALLGVVLGFTVYPAFYLLAGFVGAGMAFAGASGTCVLSNVLALAPWNKHLPEIEREVCVASTGSPTCDMKS